MTSLAVLSDIHSNLPALEAVFADLAHYQVDRVIIAGDVVNWGPFSAQVMALIMERHCATIRGNNELYLTDWRTPRGPEHWQHFTIVPFTLSQLGDSWMNVIATWPDTLSLRFRDAPAVRLVHGSPRSHFESLLPTAIEAELAIMLAGVEETTVITGHTHLALDRQADPWHLFNPGSVGNPLDGLHSASYLLLEGDATGWRGTPRHVPFDVERVLQEFERTRFVEQCGVIGHLVVEEYRTARLLVAPFLTWWRTTCPELPQTMALLDQYAEADRSLYLPAGYEAL